MSSLQPALLDHESPDRIRSRPWPDCDVCGAPGELLYEGVKDRLFGAEGKWNFRRCPESGCGLVWLDPMPLEEDIGKAYLSYYTHYDDAQRPADFASHIYGRVRSSYVATKYGYRTSDDSRWNRILGLLAYLNPIRRASFDGSVFWLNANPNGRLLEVGCGSGSMLKSMEGLGWRVEGVDFDPVAVDEAGKKCLLVHLGTLKEQEFAENSFDAIVMSHVIEHVHDPIDLLRECHRILRPGGLLNVVTPNAAGWGHRIYGADWRGMEPPRHLRIFTLSSLLLVSTQAGFRDSACRSVVRANGILLASKMLRCRGKLYKEPLTVKLRLWAEVMGLAQWAGLLVDCAAGEEIVMISTK